MVKLAGITSDGFLNKRSLHAVFLLQNKYVVCEISRTNLAWDMSRGAAQEIAEKANLLTANQIEFNLEELAQEVCDTYPDDWRGDPEQDRWAHTVSTAHVCELRDGLSVVDLYKMEPKTKPEPITFATSGRRTRR